VVDRRAYGIGRLDEEGWWNFDSIDIFKSLDDSFIFKKQAQVIISTETTGISLNHTGEFRLTQAEWAGVNLTASID
jgi:hypothetical protein